MTSGVPGALNLWGHGVRWRVVVRPGPEQATLDVIAQRRFLCRPCGSTCTVAPADVLLRHVYSLQAMLTAWFLAVARPLGDGLDHDAVYARQGVDRRKAGPEGGRPGRRRWRSLSRWSKALATWWPTRPVTGRTWRERVAMLISGFLPGGDGRVGAIRRAVNAHAARGAAV